MAVNNLPNHFSSYVPLTPSQPGSSTVASGTPVGNVGRVGENQNVRPAGGLSVAVGAGEVAYSSPNLEGIDWDALSTDYQSVENLSISMTAVLVLLVDVMKEMRKGQREAWLSEAENALAMGMSAAESMREAAACKLAADVVSNAASIATSAISLGMSVRGMVSMKAATARIQTEANALFGPKIDVPVAKDVAPKLSAIKVETEIPVSATESQTPAQATQQTQTATPEVAETPTTAAQAEQNEQQTPSTDSKKAAVQEAQSQSDEKEAVLSNQRDRAKYVAQEKANHQATLDNEANIAKSITEIGSALAKVGSSVSEYFSGQKQADAKKAEALGSYSQALMQAEMDFANQMRDAIRNILDTMKNAEQAKHQATQGIYNI